VSDTRKSTYVIRDVNPDTWRRFKTRVAHEGKTTSAVLLAFIEHYAAARYRVRVSTLEEPHFLACDPGALTTDPAGARLFPSEALAFAAIKEARSLFGRDEDLIVTEAW
jgi:hypothetical protein